MYCLKEGKRGQEHPERGECRGMEARALEIIACKKTNLLPSSLTESSFCTCTEKLLSSAINVARNCVFHVPAVTISKASQPKKGKS